MRDHTGTVESPFLICASIMSKKLAEDIRGLVLDVKVGSGAFMPTYERSKFLAELMVSTGELAGTRTAALLTTMDEPLGRFSGNWIEVWECVDILQGRRHPMSADLIELSNILSGWMLYLAGKSATPEAGAKLADDLLRSGAAYKSWLQIVAAHKGDTSIFTDPAAFHKPNATRVFKAPRAGYLSGMDCKQVGWAVQRLGAGRAKPGDPVSAHAGIESHAKLGDKLEAGQPIFTLFSEDEPCSTSPITCWKRPSDHRQTRRQSSRSSARSSQSRTACIRMPSKLMPNRCFRPWLLLHVLLDALLPVQRRACERRTLAARGAVLRRCSSCNCSGLDFASTSATGQFALGTERARQLALLELHALRGQALGGLHQGLALQRQLAGCGSAGCSVSKTSYFSRCASRRSNRSISA